MYSDVSHCVSSHYMWIHIHTPTYTYLHRASILGSVTLVGIDPSAACTILCVTII